MATTVDELIVQIRADTADLRRGLNGVKNQLGTLDKSTNQSILTFKRLAGVFAAIGIVQLGRNVINTSRTFEDLNATLRAITGSAEGAALSMDLITQFTATTTFQLENVTSAFTTLLNAGIVPTSDTLQDFGNVAAAFNKDITQIAQAAFNATTGEMEMLKQFGIIAKVEGDKLAVTFQNTTTRIDRDADSIVEFIRKIGSETFPTALEERANTVSGAFSNLADVTSILFNAIGESGLNEALVSLAKGLIDVVSSLTPIARGVGRLVNITFRQLAEILNIVRANLKSLIGALAIYVSFNIAAVTLKAAGAFLAFARAVSLAKAATVALNLASNRNVLLIGLTLATIALVDLEKAADALFATMDSLIDRFPIVGEAIDALTVPTDELTKSMDELDAELETMAANAGEAVSELPEVTETVADTIEAMNESIIASTQQMTNDFVSNLMDGQNALEGFKNFAKNLVSQIISTFLNLYVVNNILNSIFGLNLPAKSFPMGGGGVGPITRSPIPSVAESISVPAGIPATLPPSFVSGTRMTGGSVTSGSSYLVGERGPEIFTPHTAGNVSTSAGKSETPVVVNQTINLSAGVVGTVRSEVQRMLPEIANVAKVGVLEATRRGGTYRRGLLGS